MNDKSISNNFIWRLLERFGAQGVTLIVSIILARILDPDAYGAVAIISVFVSFCSIFVDGGFSAALIQKKESDDLDFSSVFYFNLIICIILYFILFLCAPFIANYYSMDILNPVLRVQAFTLIISAFKSIQITYVSKTMQFKKFFFSTIGGTLVAAVVGILMAYYGYGIWAIVIQGLVNNFIDTIILWITVKWKPKVIFSFKRIKLLFSYGWKLLVSNIVYNAYSDLRQLIIGKVYTTEDLAYYNKAYQFPKLISENTTNALNSVLFPAMSERQDNLLEVKEIVKKAIKISSYLVSPIMVGLAVVAENFILILLGEKWIFCVPYLQVFCLMFAFSSGIGAANQNALKAIGKSNLLLIIEIAKCTIDIIILLISMRFGVFFIAVGMAIGTISRMIICALPGKKYYDYSFISQIIDVLPNLILNIIMGGMVYLMSFIQMNNYLLFILQVISGIIIYLILSIITKNDCFIYVSQKIIKMIKKER